MPHPVIFDRKLIRLRRARAAKLGPATFLVERAADDLASRLSVVLREFDLAADLTIPRCMIGSSGIILTVDSARWIAPGVDELPTNTPEGFTGLFLDGAKVEFAALGIGDVTMDDVFIGTSGFSGTVGWEDPDLTWNPAGGNDGSGAFEGVLALELAGFDGGEPIEMSGRGTMVSRRQPDGSWQIVLDNPLSH